MARRSPVAAVSVSVFRGDEVLLIRRSKPPLNHQWAPPGGRINWRERAIDAAIREVKEETGVACEPLGVIDVLDWVLRERLESHHVLICFAARWIAGEPKAGSDAADARFFKLSEIDDVVSTRPISRVIRAGARQLEVA